MDPSLGFFRASFVSLPFWTRRVAVWRESWSHRVEEMRLNQSRNIYLPLHLRWGSNSPESHTHIFYLVLGQHSSLRMIKWLIDELIIYYEGGAEVHVSLTTYKIRWSTSSRYLRHLVNKRTLFTPAQHLNRSSNSTLSTISSGEVPSRRCMCSSVA